VAEHLDEARPATHHLQEPVLGDPAEVAGAQLGRGAPQREVARSLGVAEHDVRAPVDDLAVLDVDRRAGHGQPDGVGVLDREVRWQPGHPRGGLALAVHDVEVPAALAPRRGPVAHALRAHPPPGLGDVAQPGKVALGEAAALEELEGVRHHPAHSRATARRAHPTLTRK